MENVWLPKRTWSIALLAYVMRIPQYLLYFQVFLEQWQVGILQAVTIHKEINVIFKYFIGMSSI